MNTLSEIIDPFLRRNWRTCCCTSKLVAELKKMKVIYYWPWSILNEFCYSRSRPNQSNSINFLMYISESVHSGPPCPYSPTFQFTLGYPFIALGYHICMQRQDRLMNSGPPCPYNPTLEFTLGLLEPKLAVKGLSTGVITNPHGESSPNFIADLDCP